MTEHTKTQSSLDVGDAVLVQNQTGPKSNKWELSGTVVEVNGYDQYKIKMDGSGRITLRNCQFLKRIIPVSSLLAKPVEREGGVGEASDGPCRSDRLKVKGTVNTVGADQFTFLGQSHLSDIPNLEDATSSKTVSSGVGCKSYKQALLDPPATS